MKVNNRTGLAGHLSWLLYLLNNIAVLSPNLTIYDKSWLGRINQVDSDNTIGFFLLKKNIQLNRFDDKFNGCLLKNPRSYEYSLH